MLVHNDIESPTGSYLISSRKKVEIPIISESTIENIKSLDKIRDNYHHGINLAEKTANDLMLTEHENFVRALVNAYNIEYAE